ncbi:predicted protein [Lodderomyces elongisporus NRRL YB-4239]|uniref:Uncharacterized protein n=1 Tax=Lodderomyces elongisporus (strain ATCC 11503 / CBS 2605 / JCM 1781 / NBRC 1676 / NRRL YB-4239) TaxID=379508 RepID=A5DZN0_LODEL|nr:predicted protein [Lodderomyces elongisporus NRRL YB-4239]
MTTILNTGDSSLLDGTHDVARPVLGQNHDFQNIEEDEAVSSYENKSDSDCSVFDEDFLPSSLADEILTPQQLKRRSSRSQSGTLSLRPNIKEEAIHRLTIKDHTTISGKEDGKYLVQQEDLFFMD